MLDAEREAIVEVIQFFTDLILMIIVFLTVTLEHGRMALAVRENERDSQPNRSNPYDGRDRSQLIDQKEISQPECQDVQSNI